ncbi:MAG TPA: TolC family protein [Candidatus Acidoferrales bacterium]|nr:TolC family protein [Candidatus Acidoferrales bacterium]
MQFKILAGFFLAGSFPLLCPNISFAQTKFFTLDDYLGAALKMSPLIASSKLERNSAVYAREGVSRGFLPQIGINSQFILAPSAGYDPAVTNGGQLGAQLGASYVLYNGGLKNLQIQKGDLGIIQGTANLKKTQADVLYSTAVAFAGAVKEKRELDVLGQNVDLLKDYLTLVRELHASGQGSESDVLNTSVEFENAKIEADAMAGSYRNALLDLSQSSGVPSDEAADVDTTLTVVRVDTVFHDTNNVDLAAALLEKQGADFDAEMVVSQARPSVSLEADAGALTSLPNLQRGLANVLGAEVGISFTLPIITYGYYDDQYASAHLKAGSISAQNEFLRSSLTAQFAQARNNYRQANKELELLESNLSTAEKNFALAKAKYAGGGGSSLEVLNAIQLINQIEMSMEETRNTIVLSAFKMQRLNYSGTISNGE